MGGELLWEPDRQRRENSALAGFTRWVAGQGWIPAPGWDELWRWSVRDLDGFWRAVSDWAEVPWDRRPERFFAGDPGAGAGPVLPGTWCSGGRLNYAAQALAGARRLGAAPAVLSYSQTRAPSALSGDELTELVARAVTGLRQAGVGPGDRVAGYLPNIPEALIAFLATASIGAVWTAASPETGVRGVLDRFRQVEPSVLIAVDGYCYGERDFDRGAEVRQVAAGLPSLRRVVLVGYRHLSPPLETGWSRWEDLLAAAPSGAEARPVPVAFDHPLYVLYSSGTTGPPKAIVHCHGGIVLEHTKTMRLHNDLSVGDRLFWATTTGWMMWNYAVSALLVGAAVVLADGDLAPGGPAGMWEVIAGSHATLAGMGAGHLVAYARAGLRPGATYDLGGLATLGSTGSPLPAAAARWVYPAVAADVALVSTSGGTDVCTAFVGWSPFHPVWAGEISCRCLGCAVEVLGDDGKPLVGSEGELVVGAPLPSMPTGFWGDDDGHRYRAAYFAAHPGYWTHGDRMTLTERGSVIITGRSDGTLNRGGVRMGTAEFYEALGERSEVADSLVVHVEDPEGGPGVLWLFVVPSPGASFGDDARAALAGYLRATLSPRHVPDRIVTVGGIPRTLSGKRLEVPVKRILAGVPAEQALNRDAVANPDVLDEYLSLVGKGTAGGGAGEPAGRRRPGLGGSRPGKDTTAGG